MLTARVLSTKIVQWIHTAVVRPQLLFDVVVWWKVTGKRSIKNLLMEDQGTA